MHVWGKIALPALMAAALATAAGAQQKACEIDEGSPNQVARAMLDLQIAQSSQKPEDAVNKLKDAVKLLDEGDKTKNPVGRNLVLGRTLVLLMAQPTFSTGYTTRGAVGFQTNPTAPYDLIAGIDSAFTVVESSNPECVAQTAPWRQQKAWVDLVNHAFELQNADKGDSAVAVARRSLILYKNSPYAYTVLASYASKNNQPKEAIANYKEAIALAKDTTLADTRRQLLMQLGNYAADLAEANPAEKAVYLAEAKSAYEMLAKDPGTKYADAARNGQARLATMSGDTTAIRASYADQLANPGAFSYASIMNAAVTAAKANQTKDAQKLFESAKNLNPYHRDVLYNLARLYLLDSSYTKGLSTARQLLAVDPDNPDNYSLITIAYASIKKGYDLKQKGADSAAKLYGQRANTPRTAASVVKANIDSAARINPIIKAYSDSARAAVDSAIKYNDVMMKLPSRVTFSEFTPSDSKAVLGGTISNECDAPRSITVKMEFLDKAGNVVTTQDIAAANVPAKGSARFNVTGTGAGIVAFRYAPLPPCGG